MIMNFPAPLFTGEQISQVANYDAANLNKSLFAYSGASMNTRTFYAVKEYIADFLADLRPYMSITQNDLDARAEKALCKFFTRADQKAEAKIFWLAVCSFNNSLEENFRDI